MGNGRGVLVLDATDPAELAEPIANRGYEVVEATSLRAVRQRSNAIPHCVVCAQSAEQSIVDLDEGLNGSERAVVFVYEDQEAAARAVEAGATATVPRGDPGGEWRDLLAATVDAALHRQATAKDSLVSKAVDELPEILFVASLDGRLLRWNDRLSELTGYTDEVIAGMQPLELFEGSDLEAIERGIGQIVMSGDASVVAELTTQDGEQIPHEFSGSLIESNGKQVIVGTARDISNRLERERELAEQTERLETVNHVNAIIRDVMGILLAAETRNQLVAAVCDRLTAEDAYRLAWIGSYNTDTGRVEPDAWAGDGARYLEVRPTGDADDEMMTALSAIREESVVFAQDVSMAEEAAGWRSAALEHGHHAAAAIPLTYENVTYGCLCLYAGRPDAFGVLEREVLGELGAIIGHAIHAIETERALVTDTVTELQFRITDPDAFLVQIAEHAESDLSLVASIGQPDGSIVQLFEVSGVDPKAVEQFLESSATQAEVVTRRADECVVKTSIRQYSMSHVLADVGGSIRSVDVVGGDVRARVFVPQRVDASEVLDRIRDLYDIEFLARREIERGDHTDVGFRADVERRLTQRQLDVLKTAYNAEFFARPRGNTGEEVADLLDISAPTFHQHLRVGQRKLLEVLFEFGEPAERQVDDDRIEHRKMGTASSAIGRLTRDDDEV